MAVPRNGQTRDELRGQDLNLQSLGYGPNKLPITLPRSMQHRTAMHGNY